MHWTSARYGWLALRLMTLTGCMADVADEALLGGQNDAIINGALDEADPAVVMMRTESGHSCTGTLVSPTVVVTAAHCLDAAAQAGVGFGIDGWSTPATVSQQIAHPLWDGSYDSGNDVAVLVLASAVTGVTPVELDGAPHSARAGQALRIVGYGHDTAPILSGFGLKRQATVTAASSTSDRFIAVGEEDGTQTCHGDSGGPAFFTAADGVERLVGVASFGYQSCQGGAFFTRLAAYADFLDDYVSMAVPPEPPPPPPPPPDTIAPTASLASPTNGRTVPSGRRSLVFEAQDNVGVADVVLNWAYNGKVIMCSAPSAGWSCTVSGNRFTFSADIGSGTRAFTVDAYDQAGNSTHSPRYSLRFL
jgi:hypothetical protein